MSFVATAVSIGTALTVAGTSAAVIGAVGGAVLGAIAGAVIGGITAAIKGGNILEGILVGGLVGAVGGGIGGAWAAPEAVAANSSMSGVEATANAAAASGTSSSPYVLAGTGGADQAGMAGVVDVANTAGAAGTSSSPFVTSAGSDLASNSVAGAAGNGVDNAVKTVVKGGVKIGSGDLTKAAGLQAVGGVAKSLMEGQSEKDTLARQEAFRKSSVITTPLSIKPSSGTFTGTANAPKPFTGVLTPQATATQNSTAMNLPGTMTYRNLNPVAGTPTGQTGAPQGATA